MQNENNRDDRIAQRVETTTFQEVKDNPNLDEKDYTFEVEDSNNPGHPKKYMYDTVDKSWVMLIWNDVDGNYQKTSIEESDIPLAAKYVLDYLTFEEASNYVPIANHLEIDPKDYVFEKETEEHPEYPTTKYSYDTTEDTWVKYTWGYDDDPTGTSYKNVNTGKFLDEDPPKNDVPDYEGYNEDRIRDEYLDKYDASGQPYSGTGPVCYKYVNGGIVEYEEYKSEHRMDYENAYTIAIEKFLKHYKPRYHPENVPTVPDDAKTLGMAGRQIIAKNGSVSFVVFLKHGERIRIDGFNKGATYEITEIIDGIKDYKTTITDASGEQEIISKTIAGEFGKDIIGGRHVEEDPNGAFYRLLDGSGYERIDKFYADYKIGEDINNLPRYKMVYSDRPSGTYYKEIMIM